mmetsp:Transcript_11965/g.19778  ORF Transcript_11965/g.19778 Transcript_11965/m.19778 type:complete len:84 (+) Transcript_11965:439-690(+)|eukprot:CAMPEP_0175034382 /NCGR_PEP_ID=MMETSP0005-20121125/22591_1 /TAXON_ID=420556 /ORGANISM="Ochromonas sp., Strain CCMP1393" /LENGTH=83 /DNA_ID=CAMNT_0016295239 /DNA_START=330 /DNA_END=581 /DNA_ORIENTATION=-
MGREASVQGGKDVSIAAIRGVTRGTNSAIMGTSAGLTADWGNFWEVETAPSDSSYFELEYGSSIDGVYDSLVEGLVLNAGKCV